MSTLMNVLFYALVVLSVLLVALAARRSRRDTRELRGSVRTVARAVQAQHVRRFGVEDTGLTETLKPGTASGRRAAERRP